MAEKIYEPPINEPRRPRRGIHKREEEKKKENGEVPFDDVQALIRREEEAAIAVFRESDFDRRVKQRIEAPLPFPSPIHALAAVLLFLLIAVPVVVYLVSPSPAEREFLELKNYFANVRAPGETGDEEPSPAPAAASPERAALEENFKRALYTVHLRHQDITADNLPRIFDKVLFNVPLPGEEKMTAVTDLPDLEKRIKTMIEEKQVHRALSKVAQKT